MRKFLTIALALSALGLVISGCSGGDAKEGETATAGSDATPKTSEEGK